ncbi:redoxin domain-containing protein [Panacibacter ginsenosidivorans]|uniref:Redoxin domain-containing protein n=1 Tax=Panacibacter ginsenosidivorans TaxID=1813871 RepID=A0A5B8VAY0_9BACT|nr:TlpA family protein disulfide reductase [Panacibacter ginsenosidivorans]QEC68604.1 redoxin domain-containing protein [Panacibacter ginsenosidivorans]
MKNFIAFFILLYTCNNALSQNTAAKTVVSKDGYKIDATIKPYKNCWVYLGNYYGKNKVLADSAHFDENSHGIFKGQNKLPKGIYFFVTPAHSLLFEILMDDAQHFTIVADSAHLENLSVTGSPDNEIFAAYSRYLTSIAPKLNGLQQQLRKATTAADSAAIQQEQKKINKELNDYRDNVIKNKPESMVAAFFQSVRTPELKEWPKKADGTPDSLAAWRYMKDHFWDGVNFYDNSLIRTPFFDPKLEDYYKYYVPADPDSIINEVNYMLLMSRAGKDIHQYLLGKFTDKYINPEIMGQDKVFLFLFNNYFSKGDTLWLNEKQRKYIFDRAYSLMANQLNEPAPQLVLKDTLGKVSSLYEVKAPFTFIVFWDPTCSHCKVEVPKLDSIYEAKWKALGVAVFSVNTNENTFDEWKKFINENHLEGWHHAWQAREERLADEQSGVANYRQLFDIYQTPTMYLLDADKRIIAKKLSLEQYDAVIEAKLKTKTSTQ